MEHAAQISEEEMPWIFQRAEETSPSSKTRRFRDFATNEHGVSIEETGLLYRDRSVFFEYRTDDLSFEFFASSRKIAANKDEPPYVLGPSCEVTIFSDKLSRQVSAEEGAIIATNIRNFLLEYEKMPLAKPPFPSEVTFDRIARRALKL
jgi:hypothetical protein